MHAHKYSLLSCHIPGSWHYLEDFKYRLTRLLNVTLRHYHYINWKVGCIILYM